MNSAQLGRAGAEAIFGVFRNTTGATISAGSAVELEVDAITDGNAVTAAKSGSLASLFVGISDEQMVDDEYGRIQTYGYRQSAYVSAASAGNAVGTYLIAAGGILTDATLSAATTSGFTMVTLLETVAAAAGASATANRPVFIRAT